MNLSPALQSALALLRAGDAAGARARAMAGLAEQPDDPRLLSLAGMLAGKLGNPSQGADLLRRALALWPDDIATRVNLALAELALGRFPACAVLSDDVRDPRLLRVTGYARQMSGDLAGARADYEAALAALPDDFESWNNLGNTLVASGEVEAAVQAFLSANRLRPDVTAIHLNLGRAFLAADRHEDARDTLRHATAIAPEDAELQTELGLAEAASGNLAAAEAAFRAAVKHAQGFTPAYIELGLLLENLNRITDLGELIAEGARRGVREDDLALIRGWWFRRQGRDREALIEAQRVGGAISPVRRHQLLAELADRQGESGMAIAEFTRMNQASVAAAGPPPPGPSYRESVIAATADLTKAAVAGWQAEALQPGSATSPIFIMGFPRSGTTLLDTLLMNDARFHVLEELPVVRQVEGDYPSVASMASADPAAMRQRYWEALAQIAPAPSGATVVDKYPLHMARVPLIHRMFPDARLVMVERHPCDVVLSGFMANFNLNRAMRELTTLESAAALYDAVFAALAKAEELLPLTIHRIRYERMVEDLEGEMRALFHFLQLEWNPAVLDNQASASRRGHIRTASYAQVAEPIYKRAAGRWTRYREALDPVLPILAPWCERMGYPLD